MKNVDDSKDYTYKIFKLDKDSSVIIIDKNDYINKRESMINEGIDKGTQVYTTDNSLKDLELFHSFLYRNFSNHQFQEKMLPTSNKSARLNDISIHKSKF